MVEYQQLSLATTHSLLPYTLIKAPHPSQSLIKPLKMKFITPLATLALASSASAALQGKFINNCKFPVYAKTTRGGSASNAYDSREMVKVPPGGVYHARVKTINNAPGVCIKMQPAPDPAWKNVYQVEIAQRDTPWTRDGTASWAWYDLSTVNASPFKDRWRRLEVAGRKGCKILECPSGRTDCEWPVPERGEMGDCKAGRDAEVVFTLYRNFGGGIGPHGFAVEGAHGLGSGGSSLCCASLSLLIGLVFDSRLIRGWSVSFVHHSLSKNDTAL